MRELENTLIRSLVWSTEATVGVEEIRQAILPSISKKMTQSSAGTWAGGSTSGSLTEQVERHYVERALEATGGNKSRAAKLIGLPNYQTLSNWIHRLRLDSGG